MKLPSRPRLGVVSLILGLVLAAVVAPGGGGPARAAGVDLTCQMALVKSDPDTLNIAFPDEGAIYFATTYPAVPGLRLRVEGRFPFARYASFNAYDPTLRPIAAIADVEIRPDAGSSNPFLPNARRAAKDRDYTVFVEFTAPPKPADRAPNTMYVGRGQNGEPLLGGLFMYRIYLPDTGLGDRGGVPIPTVTLERAGTGEPLTDSACAEIDRPGLALVSGFESSSDGVAALDGLQPWGSPRAPFRKFVNLPTAFTDFLGSSQGLEAFEALSGPLSTAAGSGGFLSNVHNSYVSTAINRRYGAVAVVRLKVPTTPRTLAGQPRMPGRSQLRYWSMCTNEFVTQRFIDCAYDEQVRPDGDGFATFVVSTPGQRPPAARAACGVTWLAWGPNAEGVLIYRHMLADPRFRQSIQRATYRREARTMGAYLPRVTYYDDAAAAQRAGLGRC
ncbi:hypothetical protein [Nocardioides sp.]|uniref:hypothetical protein n=1 Tax=Nocardioides sp. TaxID=35761 RepID=UPI003516D546